MKKLFLTAIVSLSTYVSVSKAQDPTYLVKPSGEYSVGFHDFFWVNGTLNTEGQYECQNNSNPYYTGQNKDDFIASNQTDFCTETVVRIYYPTQKNNDVGPAYGPSLNFYTEMFNDPSLPNDRFLPEKRKELIHGMILKSYAIADKNIIQDKKFPVVFFGPGWGANVQMYENSITNLVSHGYIIVGMNSLFLSGDVALENGHIVPLTSDLNGASSRIKMRNYMQKNTEFIYEKIRGNSLATDQDKYLNSISSSFDLTNIGIYGHSLGGAWVGDMVLAHPTWFQAASPQDGAADAKPGFPTRGVYPIPVLHEMAVNTRYEWMKGDPSNFGDLSFVNLNNDGYLVIYEKDVPPDVQEDVDYVYHLNFSDFSTLQYQPSMVEYYNYFNTVSRELGTIDGWNFTHDMNTYLLNFFDTYLKKGDKIDPDFQSCKPLTQNSKLICGPASGV